MEKKSHPIIWLTGQSGSGKTTLAYLLKEKLGGVVLDGDEMRQSLSLGAGFSREDREAHNLRVARLALVLAKQSPVIVSVIAPFEETRQKIDALIKPLWVYVKKSLPAEKDRPYEIPNNPNVVADSDTASPEQNAQKVAEYMARR